jgi:hypothetical protein
MPLLDVPHSVWALYFLIVGKSRSDGCTSADLLPLVGLCYFNLLPSCGSGLHSCPGSVLGQHRFSRMGILTLPAASCMILSPSNF